MQTLFYQRRSVTNPFQRLSYDDYFLLYSIDSGLASIFKPRLPLLFSLKEGHK